MTRPALGAWVPADRLGWLLAKHLDATLPAQLDRWERGGMHPTTLAGLRRLHALIGEAGRQYADRAASVDGSAETVSAETAARSDGEISSDEAAGLLGLTPSRVRQLLRSGALPGRKVAGTWLVHRGALDLHRDVRRAA